MKDYTKLQADYSSEMLKDTISSFANAKEELANKAIEEMLSKNPSEGISKLIKMSTDVDITKQIENFNKNSDVKKDNIDIK